MTHRATELSLGLAAEQLYETLPRESRESLGDLPEVLDRLQRDAQALRKRYGELQETLVASSDREGTKEYTELRGTRDAVHVKLGEAVSALETIRLELLRLHAGSASVEGLTTHLGLAAEVSNDVQRLVAARDELNELAAD
jgi:serine/threonine-protein kinase